jgi:hypothetical protein
MTAEEIDKEIGELRQFIIETSAEMRGIDAELEPVKERERAIKQSMNSTYRTQLVEGRICMVGFCGQVKTVESDIWLGRCACGRYSLGYITIERTVGEIDHAGRLAREQLYGELQELAESFGPMRERRRLLYADGEAAKRAIERLELRREQMSRPAKPQRADNRQPRLL